MQAFKISQNRAMPKYLIHVGPHKTGTTYLQLRFDAARERLRQQGVVYPIEWSSSEHEPSHRKLMVALREARIAQLKSQFETIERNDPEYVLISAEGLNHLQQPALELLRTLVGSHPVTVIFYCRRWSELLPSLWQEKIKFGYDETFPEFFADNVSDPSESPIMNFAHRLDVYARVFGRDNIRLISYSNLRDNGIDLAEHFFDVFLPRHRSLIDGLPDLAVAWPNQSFPPLVIEVIRALNALAVSNGTPPPDATLRGWYMVNAGRFELTDLFLAIQQNQATLRFSDASPGAQRLQEILSTIYGDLMVQPTPPRFLFSPRQADIVYFQQRYLADRLSRQALEDVYTTFRAECASTP
jgi:hypothetical protein